MAAEAGPKGRKPIELNASEILQFVSQFHGRCLLLVGHGNRGSFAEIDAALLEADDVGQRMQSTCSAGVSSLDESTILPTPKRLTMSQKWCIVFGGDHAKSDRPSIGNVVKHLHDEWGAAVLAVQSKSVKSTTGVDSFCSAVHWYEPAQADTGVGSGQVVYGGTDAAGAPIAATAVYLGKDFLPHIAGVAAFGGGETTRAEVAYALRVGLPLKYIPCAPLTPPKGGVHPYGPTHEYLMDMGVAEELTLSSAEDAAASGDSIDSMRSLLAKLGAAEFASKTPPPTPSTPLEDTRMCMTMHQPWASLMVYGIKRAEGRVWTPSPPFSVSDPPPFSCILILINILLLFTIHCVSRCALQGRLWIHAGGKMPTPEGVMEVEAMYRTLLLAAGMKDEDIKFPAVYPTGCLIGSVDVPAVLPNATYRSALAGHVPPSVLAESKAPYVFLCQNPQRLLAPIEMTGSFKLYKLPKPIWKQAVHACEPAEPLEPVAFPAFVSDL